MQILLLGVTLILAVILYRMLSSRRATYPYVQLTRVAKSEKGSECRSVENEEGLVTIDKDTVIIEGVPYSLKEKRGRKSEAFLQVEAGKLICVGIRLSDGSEKLYHIDPSHSLFAPFRKESGATETHRLLAV